MRSTALLSVVVLALAGTACQPAQTYSQKVPQVQGVEAEDLGDGIYYISKPDGSEWVASLKRFVREHPDRRITAIAPSSESKFGAFGRLLITEARADCAK